MGNKKNTLANLTLMDIPMSLIIFAILFTLLSLLFFVDWLLMEYISIRWDMEFRMKIDAYKRVYPFDPEPQTEHDRMVELYIGYNIFREQVQIPLLALTFLSGAYHFLKHRRS